MMTLRYLASFEGVHCPAQINDAFGNFIAHTQLIPERNIYAAVLTRAQWDKLRAERWSMGGLINDGGHLVPDVDFVASDGRVFLDFNECQAHESRKPMAEVVKELEQTNPLPPSLEENPAQIAIPSGTLADVLENPNPTPLESKILTAIGKTTMQVRLLASFLRVTEEEVREVVTHSPRLRFSASGKSVSLTE